MKKLGLLVLGFMISFTALFFSACEKKVEISFSQESYQLQINNEVSALSFITGEVSEEEIEFRSSDLSTVFITSKNTLVALNVGETYIYAYVNGEQKASCQIQVVATENIAESFSSPVNIKFNFDTQTLSWEKVYTQGENGVVFASSYTVEITKDEVTKEYCNIKNNIFGKAEQYRFENGDYQIRVKADASGKYGASSYQETPYLFSIMASPTNLAISKDSNNKNILTWEDSVNAQGTKYQVEVFKNDFLLEQYPLTTTEKSLELPTFEKANYKFVVKALPSSNKDFPSNNAEYSISFLQNTTLSFSDGKLSWVKQADAKNYLLTLYKNETEKVYEKTISQNLYSETITYDFSADALITEGNYNVTVQAIGDETKNVFDGDVSDKYYFSKLEAPQVVYSYDTNSFSVSKQRESDVVELKIFDANKQEVSAVDFTQSDKFTISAKVIASDETREISSAFTTTFIVAGSENNYTTLQKLKSVDLAYSEINGDAIISFAELNEDASYSLSINNVSSSIQETNCSFNLGSVNTLFNGQQSRNFKVEITKQSNDTLFISTYSIVQVKKLSNPTSIKINSNTFEVENNSENPNGSLGLSVYVNNVNTRKVDTSVSTTIRAQYQRQTTSVILSGIKTYYTSSDFAEFYLDKLEAPNSLSYNYQTNTLTWDSVENATEYVIYRNNAYFDLSAQTSWFNENKINGTFSVVAKYGDITEIEADEHAYMNSAKSETIEVVKLNEIKNLVLTKDETNVYISWSKPQNSKTIQPTYDVLVDNTSVLSQTLSTESFTLPLTIFSDVKNYIITVCLTDNNQYYFDETNKLSVVVTKLPKITTLTNVQNVLYAEKLTNTQTLLSVQGYTAGTSFNMSQIASGEEVVVYAKYTASFNQNGYYLENDATAFTIQKLNTPTNLLYENGKITWQTDDSSVDGGIQYYFHFDNETANSITNNAFVENISRTQACTFYVCEKLVNAWTTISENGKKYISSTDFASLQIQQQNSITNVQVEETQTQLNVSWNLVELESLPTTFRLTFGTLVDNKTYTELFNGTSCVYSLDKTLFGDAKDYSLSIVACNKNSFDSVEKTLTITKFDKVYAVEVENSSVVCLDINKQNFEASSNYELDIDDNTITVSNFGFSVAGIGQTQTINVFIKALNQSMDDVTNYYLSSDKTAFTFSRLNVPTIIIDSEQISWQNVENANYYTLKFTQNGVDHIFTSQTNNFSLNDAEIFAELSASGNYDVTIQSNKTKVIFETQNALIESLFGSQQTINKLESVGDITTTVSNSDVAQKEVTFNWTAVDNAQQYDIFVGTSQDDISTLIGTANTNSFATNYFQDANTYYVVIVAKASGRILSNPSNVVTITRLSSIQNLYLSNVTDDCILYWTEPTSQKSLASKYIIKILSKTNGIMSTYDNVSVTDNANSFTLTNDTFINEYEGGNIRIQICLVGNGGGTNTANLSSAFSEVVAYKLQKPTFSIENGKVKITSDDYSESNPKAKYIYSVYSLINTTKHYYVQNAVYSAPIEIQDTWIDADEFKVEAYAIPYQNDSAYYNLVQSQLATSDTYERVPTVTGLRVDAQENDIIHNVVNIKWQPSSNATGYKILVNSEVVGTVPAGLNNGEFVVASNSAYFANTLFSQAGEYSLSIIAYSNTTLVSSLPCETVTVTRLNPIETLRIDVNQNISFTPVTQVTQNNPYYLELVSKSSVVQDYVGQNKDFTNTTHKFTSSYIDDLISGTFYVNVRVIGSGTFANNSIVLTSNKCEIECYKLKAPTIQITDDQTFVISSDDLSNDKYTNHIQFKYEIVADTTYQGDYSVPISVRDDWLNNVVVRGYATTYSTSLNVVTSNTTSRTFERLTSPEITDIQITNKNKSNENVKLVWSAVTGATGYTIFIGNENVATVSTTYCYITDFVKTQGNYVVSVTANDLSNKISSLKSQSVNVIRLKPIEEITVNSTKNVSWIESDSQLATSSLYYYYLAVQNNNHTAQESYSNLAVTSYDIGAESSAYINTLEGGTFYLAVQCRSDENFDSENKRIILSSSAVSILAYKLFPAECELIEDNTKIELSSKDTSYADDILIYYSITKDGNAFIAKSLYQSEIDTTTWANGNYTITTWVCAKDGTQNLINSNSKDFVFEQLATASDIAISSNTSQSEITLSWTSVANATQYDVYIDDEKVFEEITSNSCDISSYVQDAGSYEIFVIAKSQTAISSLKSDVITVIRLDEAQDLYMDSSAITHFDISNISDANYFKAKFVITINGTTEYKELENTASSTINITSFNDFVANVQAIDGGEFEITLQLIGSGTLNDDKIATLSSGIISVNVYKFYVPTITVLTDHLTIVSSHSTDEFGDSLVEEDVAKILFTITYNSNYALDEDNKSINDKVFNTTFVYPESWLAGQYTITTHSVINDSNLRNVINSNISSQVTTTRLTAPSDIYFNREVVTDTSKYVADVAGLTYLSDKIYLNFTNTEYANGHALRYEIKNGDESQSTLSNKIDYTELYDLISSSTGAQKTLRLTTIAVEGGEYINSAPSEISFNTLEQSATFNTSNGKANWDKVTNASTYLISNNACTAYWQSDSAITTSSDLQVLSDKLGSTGQITLKIKSVGNISTTGTLNFDGEIYLDSSYKEATFNKLSTVSGIQARLGFISFEKVSGADTYEAVVPALSKTYVLSDYSSSISAFSDGTQTFFVGYNEELSEDLQTNTLYQIKIRAYNNSGENFLSSKLSTAVNFKILETSNTSTDIKIYCLHDSYVDTVTRLNLAQNAYGLLRLNSGGSVWETPLNNSYSNSTTESVDIAITPTAINNDKNFSFSFMQLGSSHEENDGTNEFYYLNSRVFNSLTFYQLKSPTVCVNEGVISWDTVEEADGYYLYLDGNLVSPLLNTTSYDVPDEYGSNVNENISVKVVAVATSPEVSNKLYSVESTFNAIKQKAPFTLEVDDGVLYWNTTDAVNYNGIGTNEIILTLSNGTISASGEFIFTDLLNIGLTDVSIVSSLNGLFTNTRLMDKIYNWQNALTSGEYTLTIQQKGDSTQYLNSKTTTQNIYIPDAPEISLARDSDSDFILQWNPVNVNHSGYGHASDDSKYMLYGETATGERRIICRTSGDGISANGKIYLDITELIDSGVLTSEIKKLFVVVSGDDINVVKGLVSNILDVTILETVTVHNQDGAIVWDQVASSCGYQLCASTISGDLTNYDYIFETTDERAWIGDATKTGQTTLTNGKYKVVLRAIGNGNVISGKRVTFNVEKLQSMTVSTNIYGSFVWNEVTNSYGLIYSANDFTDCNIIKHVDYSINNIDVASGKCYFVPEEIGANTYYFRALGSSEGDVETYDVDETVPADEIYYINSALNGDGIKAENLPQIVNFGIENGLIKWTKSEVGDDFINPEIEKTQLRYGYKISLSNSATSDRNVGVYYSTDLSESIFETDGNNCILDVSLLTTDSEGRGLDAGTYYITISEYLYYELNDGSDATITIKNMDSTTDTAEYNVLLGQSYKHSFEKIETATSVEMKNGRLIWTNPDEKVTGYEILVSQDDDFEDALTTSQILTLPINADQFDINTFWPSDADQTNYYIKLRAFSETKVYSNYVVYSLDNITACEIIKCDTLDTEYELTSSDDARNLIVFDYTKPLGYDVGFNIRFRENSTGDWTEVLCVDRNNNLKTDLVYTYEDGTVSIDITELNDNLPFFQYAVQVVPLGSVSLFMSNYVDDDNIQVFSTPDAPAEVFFNNTKQEYSWEWSAGKIFMVKDEILDSSNTVIATYQYVVDGGTSWDATKPYLKEEDGNYYVLYQPSVMGVKHKVSVAGASSNSLRTIVSGYTHCEDICNLSLFTTQTAFTTISSQANIELFVENYASADNPYLITTLAEYQNIEKRLQKYDYQSHYLFMYNDMVYEIDDENSSFVFQLQENLSIENFILGVDGKFTNIIDGNNKTITYTLSTNDVGATKIGLVQTLGQNGEIKNLNIGATLNFNKTNSNDELWFGGVASVNEGGKISNCNVEINTSTSTANNSNIKGNIYFGGIVGNNSSGTIENCVTSSISGINISFNASLSRNAGSGHIGGIAGINKAIINECGNNANISITNGQMIRVGGITGNMNSATAAVGDCFNKGSISANVPTASIYVGGLVGYVQNGDKITYSYNIGTITCQGSSSTAYVGGLVGKTEIANINMCYSIANVNRESGSSGDRVGLLFGSIPSSVGNQVNYHNINSTTIPAIGENSNSTFGQYTSNITIIIDNNEHYKSGTDYPLLMWEL